MAKEVYPHNCNAATSSRLCSSVQALQQPADAAALQQPAGIAVACSNLHALQQSKGTAAAWWNCSSMHALQQPACTAAVYRHCSSLQALQQSVGTSAVHGHCSCLQALQQPCRHCRSLQALQKPAGTAASCRVSKRGGRNMHNSSNLGPFKQKMPQKCITFDPKLRFTKFKGLNRSEFYQKLEFSSTF